jgi:hypothetical protein
MNPVHILASYFLISISPNIVDEWSTLLFHIWEDPALNLDLETGHPA